MVQVQRQESRGACTYQRISRATNQVRHLQPDFLRKEKKKNYAGSKTLPASIKEKDLYFIYSECSNPVLSFYCEVLSTSLSGPCALF
jgi:hypothetical protein